MASEKEWVLTLVPRLVDYALSLRTEKFDVGVITSRKLAYTSEIFAYELETNEPKTRRSARYETDLLIYDAKRDRSAWTPRVIIECKIRGVTTHDALTYSAKAATHKHVHPYLRYGILIGAFGESVPARLIRHGAYFDFMTVWKGSEPTGAEWERLTSILRYEIESSRRLEQALTERGQGKSKVYTFHRHLVINDT